MRSIHTPFGDMTVAQEGVAIVSVDWGWGRDQDDTPLLREALAQLDAYFSGKLKTFDLPLAIEGTPFQRRVWQTMQQIPYGETRTYGDVAQELNSAARAVGGACGPTGCRSSFPAIASSGPAASAVIPGRRAGDQAADSRPRTDGGAALL
ncbi:methylated-DNA--[protein]-cysteine S-methyltransferase [Hankyongella ginsenosidimutans]|uniref:methylated-DNA--[protein]-cysteine S-methyltransferase n=1 Tax=Hankyongella ginsenosidimutans TaxID=1763828 RepID=UPI001CA306BC|nr:methylated-DNA--[protein]-cysteine S-methyltransferase [Hankyongella ginsenosidimutans]